MAEFVVELERDEAGGAWIARVPSVPGCHTHGRSIDQALNRTREALGLWIPKTEAAKADLVPEVHLPEAVKAELFELAAARERARSAQEEASSWLKTAVHDLTRREGLSVRDVARVVELSPQRVQ
jgi:predicted RNase H-like HicB family nuclease